MIGKETELVERYQIISSVSQDALGKVYLAEDAMLSRNIVLRHIKAQLHNEAGFKEYANCLVGLNHPGVLATYDLAIAKGKVYFVSQFMEGESLAEVVGHGAMKPGEVYAMAEQLVDAMQAILGAGLSHGALNLGSVKRSESVAGRHRYVICDLGFSELACLLGIEGLNSGDCLLRAPEKMDEKAVPDEKSMMFAVGQLCYMALVGGHPFAGKSAGEVRDSYLRGELPSIQSYVADLQEDFVRWVMRMVAVAPEGRYESFAEAAGVLGSFEVVDPLDAKTAAIAVEAMRRTGPQPVIAQEVVEKTEAVEAVVTPQVNLTGTTPDAGDEQKVNELSSKLGMDKKQLVMISGLCGLVLVGLLFLLFGGGSADKDGDRDDSDQGVAEKAEEPDAVKMQNQRFEAEGMYRSANGGKVENQLVEEFNFSEDTQLYWIDAKEGDVLHVTFHSLAEVRSRLLLGLTRAPDYGIFDVYLNGKRVKEGLDLYDEDVTAYTLDLGECDLEAGENKFRFVIRGINPKAVPQNRYMFGLDYIEFMVPVSL